MRMNAEKALLNVGGDINMMRPYTLKKDNHAKTYVNFAGKPVEIGSVLPQYQNVTGLPIDSWKEIDKAVMGYQKGYKTAFNDVLNAGLTKDISMYSKLFSSQKLGSTGNATVDMDGVSNRDVDSPTFDNDTIPMYIVHKDFEISWRNKPLFGTDVYGKGSLGIEWDDTMMSEGIDKIEKKHENIIFNGYSQPYNSSYIYGYCNFTNRNQVDLTYDWTNSSTTAANIYDDVKEMWKDCFSENKQQYTDGILYVRPSAFVRFNEYVDDYYTKTLRDLVLELEGVEAVKVTDELPSDQDAVMVRMDSRSVRIIRGTPNIIPVMQYEDNSRMHKLSLLSIRNPQLRVDAEGYTSITHGNYSD